MQLLTSLITNRRYLHSARVLAGIFIMEINKEDLLSVDELANELHNAGLTAWNPYQKMGKSGDQWSVFRKSIANELLKKLEVSVKRRPNE